MRLSPASVSLTLLAAFVALLMAHLAVAVLRIEFDRDYIYGLAPVLDFDREGSAPAWFSGLLLALASVVSFICALYAAKVDRRQTAGWIVVGLVMAFLSFDESAAIHELLSGLGSGQGITRLGGWAVLYVPLVVGLSLWLLPFLFRLPRYTAVVLVVSGVMFVAGAVVLESVGTRIVEAIAGVPITQVPPEKWLEIRRGWPYVLELTLEESLEMCGVIVFIYGALDYLARYRATITLDFATRTPG